MFPQTLRTDQNPPIVIYFQWKKLRQKAFERSIFFPWKVSILIQTHKGKGLNLKRFWVLVKKYNILFWRWCHSASWEMWFSCLMSPPSLRDRLLTFHGAGWVTTAKFFSLFFKTPCSPQMKEVCGITDTILTRSHGSVFDSLFGLFTGKCSGFSFFGFWFFPRMQNYSWGK